MTVLPNLEQQLVNAAADKYGHSDAERAGRAERAEAPPTRRWRRARLSRLALAFSVIPVLVVAAIILTTRGGGAGSQTTGSGTTNSAAVALREAAAAARTGAAAPKLRAGQAWYTASVEVTSDQSFPGIDKPPGASLTTGESRLAKWITADGTEYEATRGLPGLGRFSSFSSGTPSGPVGFGDWDPFPSQRLPAASHPPEPQAFPAIATAVPRFLAAQHQGYWQYTHGNRELNDTDQSPFTELAQLSAYLGDWPLRPVSRGVAFEAIARLPGLLYLGQTTDPSGRAGLGVAEDATGIAPFELAGRHPPRQGYRFVVILDPKTGQVLGSKTIELTPLALRGAGVGEVLFSWVYGAGRVVPYTPAVKRAEARTQAMRRIQEPGGACYRPAGPRGAIGRRGQSGACSRAIQRLTRLYRGP